MQLRDQDLLRERCYVGGDWIQADAGGWLTVTDPACGAAIARVPDLGAAETRRAIASAQDAWPAWRGLTAAERSAHLRRWHDLMLAHTDDLARIMTAEQGKPLAEARGEIAYGASFIDWFAEEGRRVYGDMIPTATGRQAHPGAEAARGGLCRHHPLELPHRHDHPQGGRGAGGRLHPGGQAGGTDAPLGPGTGGPGGAGWAAAGVFNVVTGQPEPIGAELTSNPTVRKLSFTGSTRSWAAPHATVRRYPQAPVPGTGR